MKAKSETIIFARGPICKNKFIRYNGKPYGLVTDLQSDNTTGRLMTI